MPLFGRIEHPLTVASLLKTAYPEIFQRDRGCGRWPLQQA